MSVPIYNKQAIIIIVIKINQKVFQSVTSRLFHNFFLAACCVTTFFNCLESRNNDTTKRPGRKF